MTPILAALLVSHVVLGLAGTAGFVAALVLLTRDVGDAKSLSHATAAGFVGFVLSWFLGGYYYSMFYGAAIKPIIKAGAYPWVHDVLMEAKEHVFLFLPFLAAAAAATAWLASESISRHKQLKRAYVALIILIVTLGAAMALMGAAISGAVDKTT